MPHARGGRELQVHGLGYWPGLEETKQKPRKTANCARLTRGFMRRSASDEAQGSLTRGLVSGEGSRNSTFQKTSRHPLQTRVDVQSMYVTVTFKPVAAELV